MWFVDEVGIKLCRLFRAVLLQEGGDLLLENLLKFRFGYKFVSGYPRFQTVDNFYRRCDSHIRRDQGVFQLIEGLCIHSVFTGDTFSDLKSASNSAGFSGLFSFKREVISSWRIF